MKEAADLDPRTLKIHNEKLKEVETLLLQVGESDYWKCKVCSKTLKLRSRLREHAEFHVEGLSYQCQSCSRICPDTFSLKNHYKIYHRDASNSASENAQHLKNNLLMELEAVEPGSGRKLLPKDKSREINEKIEDKVEQDNSNEWSCKKCLKIYTRKSDLQTHLQSKLHSKNKNNSWKPYIKNT